MRIFELTVTLAAVIALGGCGGSSSAGNAPTPTPTPSTPAPSGGGTTPTPTTPAPTTHTTPYPPAPFGLVADAQFSVLGWALQDAAGKPANSGQGLTLATRPGIALVPLTDALIRLGWDAAVPTYRVDAPGLVQGLAYYYYFGTAEYGPYGFKIGADKDHWSGYNINIYPESFPSPSGGSTASFTLAKESENGLTMIGIFGLATPASAVPAGGVRRYRTREQGENATANDVRIDIDFTAGTLSGVVPVTWYDAWGPYGTTAYPLATLSFTPGSRDFVATFKVAGAPTDGKIQGRLMGPDGDQLALAYRSPIRDPYDLRWTELYGVWITYRCTSCTS